MVVHADVSSRPPPVPRDALEGRGGGGTESCAHRRAVPLAVPRGTRTCLSMALPACPRPPLPASASRPSSSHGSPPALGSGAQQGWAQPMGPFSAWHGGEASGSLGCSSGRPDPGSPAVWGAARPCGVPGAAPSPTPGGRTLDAGVADSAFGPRRSFCLGNAGLRSQFAAAKGPGGGRGSSVPAAWGPPEPALCPHSPAHPWRMTVCPSGAGRPPVPRTAPLRTPSPSAPR